MWLGAEVPMYLAESRKMLVTLPALVRIKFQGIRIAAILHATQRFGNRLKRGKYYPWHGTTSGKA